MCLHVVHADVTPGVVSASRPCNRLLCSVLSRPQRRTPDTQRARRHRHRGHDRPSAYALCDIKRSTQIVAVVSDLNDPLPPGRASRVSTIVLIRIPLRRRRSAAPRQKVFDYEGFNGRSKIAKVKRRKREQCRYLGNRTPGDDCLTSREHVNFEESRLVPSTFLASPSQRGRPSSRNL